MSITNAMQASVSGLNANATAVGRISANIANANTDGYRRSFAQMVTSSVASAGGGAPPAGGVNAVVTSEVDSDGQLRMTQRSTDLAISGSGLFVVSKSPNETSASNYLLTRAGAFLPDENGNLKNAAGYYLAGFQYDDSGSLGVVDRNSFTDMKTVNVSSMTVPGGATSAVTLSSNLPSQETGLATPGDPYVATANVFTPLGNTQRLQFSWQPSATANEWQLDISDDTGATYGSVNVSFNDSGPNAGTPSAYTGITSTATAPAAFSFNAATGVATLTLNNGSTPQTLTVDLGAPGALGGMTQFAGAYTPPDVTADGAASGALMRVEIGESGDVYGIFDNGSRRALFNIPLAEVPNPNGLIEANGNAYLPSNESGAFRLATAGTGSAGTITSQALEGSNVDIAQELTNLIQTQRAYSSNAKIITTVDEMLDETMRIKR